MKSVDTNLLVRILMNDDADQAALARTVVEAGALVSPTVLLETTWLLRSRYGLSRSDVIDALLTLSDLPGLMLIDANLIRWAIGRYAGRGDFADLMHIVTSRGAEAFVTFDRGIAAAAGPDTPIPIETLA